MAAASDPDEEALPAGWAIGQAPNGRVFYIDHNTQTTTWVNITFICSGVVVESCFSQDSFICIENCQFG